MFKKKTRKMDLGMGRADEGSLTFVVQIHVKIREPGLGSGPTEYRYQLGRTGHGDDCEFVTNQDNICLLEKAMRKKAVVVFLLVPYSLGLYWTC